MRKSKLPEWEKPEAVGRLYMISRRGLKDYQIAEEMGVSRRTFYYWLSQSEKIKDALELGRSPWKREQRLRELNGRDPEGPDLIECPQGVNFC